LNWIKKRIKLALNVSAPIALVLVIIPSLIILGDKTFSVSAGFWIINLTATLSFSIVLSLAVSIFSTKAQKVIEKFSAIFFVGALLIAIIFPEGGRRLDGVEAEVPDIAYLLSVYAGYFILTVLIFFFALKKPRLFRELFILASIYCLLLTTYTITTRTSIGVGTRDGGETYSLKYGSNSNIVFILADMLQGSSSEQLFLLNKELAQKYNGFTLYSRAVSPFPFTNYGLPSILSGKLYAADPNAGYLENLRASQADSFVTDSIASGYYPTLIGMEELKIDPNQFSYKKHSEPALLAVMFVNLSLTRLTKIPNLLSIKKRSPGDELILPLKHQSLQVMEKMAKASIGQHLNKITVVHNMITHSPNFYSMKHLSNPKLDWKPFPLDTLHYMDELSFFFYKLEQIITHMKDIGIYDESLIIISGDHGHFAGKNTDLYIRYPGAKDFLGFESGPWARSATMYNPAILIKPPNSRGSFSISHDSLSTLDLRSMIKSVLLNRDVLKNLGDLTERKNIVIVFRDDAKSNPYSVNDDHILFPFHGNASNLALEFLRSMQPRLHYDFSKLLSPPNDYLDGNWLKERNSAWLQDRIGRFIATISNLTKANYVLSIQATPLINESHLVQRVNVFVNEVFVDQVVFDSPNETVELIIPNKAISASIDKLTISFEPLDAKSPLELGLWQTSSPISILVHSLSIKPLKHTN